MNDYQIVLIAQEIAAILATRMSAGQIKALLPDICKAVKMGDEQYQRWEKIEEGKLFSNRRKEKDTCMDQK